ncbi:MAG: LysR family transcriptional regulator [Clostridia bacterium]|nr:LysR family transcriptional regulator [Clostridia bacterium]
MTITQMETFLKIAETRNFTTAASLLGYAQSTVTMQIKQLEEELGCLLFERLGKTVTLTAEGERLCEYAAKMMQLEREIHLEVPTVKEPAGVLRLGVSESLCYQGLPQVLLKYKQMDPRVEIQLSFIMHDTFPALLKKGTLDIAYSLNPPTEYGDLDMLYDRAETLGFYASPEHPLAKKKSIREKDLEGVPLLLTSHNCSFRHMLLEDLSNASVTPQIALETSSKEILKQFAINELGVAFMPDMAAHNEAAAGQLKRLDWAGNAFPVCSRIYVHKDKHVNTAIRELVSILSGDAEE